MNHKLLWTFIISASSLICSGQTPDTTGRIQVDTSEIYKSIETYQQKLDSLKQIISKVEAAPKAIDSIVVPIWTSKLKGIFGFDFNQFSNWVGRGNDFNSTSAAISSTLSGRIGLKKDDIFWINRANIAVGWQRFENSSQDLEIQRTADLFNLSSHFGTNLSDHLALSIFGEWRTQLIDVTTSPSYLDMSLGMTWTPNDYFMMTMHPVNYELVLSNRDQFLSSFGAKMVVNYERNITEVVSVKSHFNSFVSYRDIDMLSNYTWTNGLNIKIMNSIGLGIEYALRVSPQETNALSIIEDLQSYVVMGISYVL